MNRRALTAVVLFSTIAVLTALWRKESFGSDTGPQSAYPRMSDQEFSHLRVSLPQPVDMPWEGPFFNSENCFKDEDTKRHVVEILPTWIRKALKAGKTELAAKYLWTLERLAEDKNPSVSLEAVLAIYNLGDCDEFAHKKMSDWIAQGFNFKASEITIGQFEYMFIRARVLKEITIFQDKSFDGVIYDIWMRTRAEEAKYLNSVDYGYYLEKHGRELPTEYWLERLSNPYGFTNTLEIAEKKVTPQIVAKLTTLFDELHERPPITIEASRAAGVASALFRQTGDVRYRDYLIERARPQLAANTVTQSLSSILDGLAATKDKVAFEVVANAMKNENGVIGGIAAAALGKTREPAATELLFEVALQNVKEGKGFPRNELQALLIQGYPAADSKYEQLRQKLLSGELPRKAVESDFYDLEFLRKYGRH